MTEPGHLRKSLLTIGIVANDLMFRLCHLSDEPAKHIVLESGVWEPGDGPFQGSRSHKGQDEANCLGQHLLDLVEG